jgi:hypothetical protein
MKTTIAGTGRPTRPFNFAPLAVLARRRWQIGIAAPLLSSEVIRGLRKAGSGRMIDR